MEGKGLEITRWVSQARLAQISNGQPRAAQMKLNTKKLINQSNKLQEKLGVVDSIAPSACRSFATNAQNENFPVSCLYHYILIMTPL